MASMTEKMSEASAPIGRYSTAPTGPKKGDRYRCATCGMQIEVTADCRCSEPGMVHFQCCGHELHKA